MGDWTQLGIAGLTLGILFFIVKYFVKEQTENRIDAKELTERFIKMSEDSNRVQSKLTEAIQANTIATKNSTDNITKLLVEVIKSK